MEGLICLTALGIMVAACVLAFAIMQIINVFHNAKAYRVICKYPELHCEMVKYNNQLDAACAYHNDNIAPLERKIDRLCADNYIVLDKKEAQLAELRAQHAEYTAKYEEYCEEYRRIYADIQMQVNKCDKDIEIFWPRKPDNPTP